MRTFSHSPLSVVKLPGLHLDTLGHYFAALGLLRLTARKWTTVNGCWRDGVFCLVGGPQDFTELESFVLNVGANNQWTQYTINRPKNTQSDSPEKKARDLAIWLARDTGETEATLAQSHVAAGLRREFNPVFGTGGNAGKRNFSKGWEKARDAVRAVVPSASRRGKKKTETQPMVLLPPIMPTQARQDLKPFLYGEACSLLADYGAACWFSAANKIYNFSPDKPYREGQITPWAMLLACEAFPLLVGSTSRQIGSQRQGTGAFPFVTQGAAPEAEKEASVVEGEFWAPIWGRPLSLAEVSALFKRGRAEVNGHGAITSAAFAAAIIQKGTDSGLAEFRRFSLLHTTSTQTFESRLASVHPLSTNTDAAQSTAVSRIIRFRDALPREYKKGKSWIYCGLQGPIDNALVRLASAGKNAELRTERSWNLLDAVFASLEKTANNKTYREREPQLNLFPVSWAISLLEHEHEITPELRIAIALATLRADGQKDTPFYKTTAPLLAYRIGVVPAWKSNWRKIKIAKNPPLRVVWSQRGLAENLCAIIQRRVSVESDGDGVPPFNTQLPLSIGDVFEFLHYEIDDALIERWLIRFMLFDWSFVADADRRKISSILEPPPVMPPPQSSPELLHAFFRPLFHNYTFSQLDKNKAKSKGDSSSAEKKRQAVAPTAGMLRPFVALLSRGDAAAAQQAAFGRYKSFLKETVDFGDENEFALENANSLRLLAAMLLPAPPANVVKTFSRWSFPTRNE
ncbi:MAG: type I-U CRISPR-associated protein Csx17 [Anaerolineaceae bacterium]|nr:MAG: type I-U CRISPR-associated protein Csx17 [Anaerolineaceae bacterium]